MIELNEYGEIGLKKLNSESIRVEYVFVLELNRDLYVAVLTVIYTVGTPWFSG